LPGIVWHRLTTPAKVGVGLASVEGFWRHNLTMLWLLHLHLLTPFGGEGAVAQLHENGLIDKGKSARDRWVMPSVLRGAETARPQYIRGPSGM
jgi:hypothetical protein